LHDSTLQREFIRHPFIIRIEESDKWVPRRLDAVIAGGSRATTRDSEKTDTVAIGGEHRCRVIG
jgi:hypothetical protein